MCVCAQVAAPVIAEAINLRWDLHAGMLASDLELIGIVLLASFGRSSMHAGFGLYTCFSASPQAGSVAYARQVL